MEEDVSLCSSRLFCSPPRLSVPLPPCGGGLGWGVDVQLTDGQASSIPGAPPSPNPLSGLLDGNYPLWAKEGRPVSTDSTKVDPRPFRVTFRTDRHATRSEVLAALEAHTARVIDARTEAEHTGAQAKAKRGGHIPTACHL